MLRKLMIAPLLFSSVASASDVPNPNQVYIKRITYAGNGCADGTVSRTVAPDAKSFSLIFDDFTVEAGPGIPAGKSQSKCKITVDLKYPQGWSYTLFKFDYRGYASLQSGLTGYQNSKYYFQSNPSEYVTFNSTFTGPYDNDFTFSDEILLDEETWAPCGKQRALNVETDLSISGNTTNEGLITVDSIDGKLTHIYGIKWERCE
jgi:hypothetical protein